MRKIMMTMVVIGLFTGAAHAQGVATQSINLTATVGGYCTIDGVATGTVRSATVPVANGVNHDTQDESSASSSSKGKSKAATVEDFVEDVD